MPCPFQLQPLSIPNGQAESTRGASGLFHWRDHVNALGGVCTTGSTYDTSCSTRHMVVVKIYYWDFYESQIPLPPGMLLPKAAWTNNQYLNFWDTVCNRPDGEQPHIIMSPTPTESVMPSTYNGQVNSATALSYVSLWVAAV